VRERGPILNPASQLSDPVVLMRGRIQVRFAYRDAGGQTYDQWGNKPNLPSAVLVQVLAQDGAPVFPTAFVLPVPVNLGADCLVDQGDATPPHCNGTPGNSQGQNAPPPTAQPPNPQQEPQ